MEPVTTRLPKRDAEALAELESAWSADRSEALRRLISQSLAEWRTEQALDGLREHSLTMRQAAEQADISYVELLTRVAEEGIDVGYTTDDLERDLDRL